MLLHFHLGLSLRVWFIAAALLPYGCGPKPIPTGTLSGTVRYKGKPVTEGTINFSLPQRGIGYVASLDTEGRFTIPEPLEVGRYAVSLSPPVGDPDTRPLGRAKPPGIPLRFQDERSSGLTFEIVEGTNTATIELKE